MFFRPPPAAHGYRYARRGGPVTTRLGGNVRVSLRRLKIELAEGRVGFDAVLAGVLRDDADGEEADDQVVGFVRDAVLLAQEPDAARLGGVHGRTAPAQLHELGGERVRRSGLAPDGRVEGVWVGGHEEEAA